MRFRLYMIVMLLILVTGIISTIMASSPSALAVGLASISVGGGGLSSGIVTRLGRRP
ncbi:hypothetical protein AHiyo8_pI67850 (plasmid) [Arthrobacter sp. Hiyo8]|nr:hypothetical protein AHiyo8_pI67850 [Arthrobacter sp. Hiyo8]GAP60774.1 hypothetical protein AHiyo1_43610 [Arthrobacter sp. Hiyo1]